MSDKVLVELFVPVIQRSWDVWLSRELSVAEAVELLGNLAGKMSHGLYCKSGDMVLCDFDTGLVYDASATVADAGLANGAKLMLL